MGSSATCRFCHAPLSEKLVDLGKTPVANAYVRPEAANAGERIFPLCAYVCPDCFLVQLEAFTTSEEMFSDYFYRSSFSDTWLKHAQDYAAAMVARFGVDERSQVVEVASNDGYLLQFFKQRSIPVLGVEPAANIARTANDAGISTRVAFWSVATAEALVREGIQADLLVGNNVLAHVPDINDFVGGLEVALKPQGVLTMEFPHLMNMVELCQFDTIYHEHYSYLSFSTAERIFKAHGITLFDVEELPTHGGSLRIYGKHAEDSTKDVSDRVPAMRQRELAAGYGHLEVYRRFAERVRRLKWDILEFLIRAKREGKTIAGYGAPAKATTLLNYCGIGTDFVDYTVDRNVYKQGCFLPGVRIPIHAPDRIRETKPDYLIIFPWNIRQEIVDQMSEIRAWGGQFVTLVPEVTILT